MNAYRIKVVILVLLLAFAFIYPVYAEKSGLTTITGKAASFDGEQDDSAQVHLTETELVHITTKEKLSVYGWSQTTTIIVLVLIFLALIFLVLYITCFTGRKKTSR